jgi:hypothetical protein
METSAKTLYAFMTKVSKGNIYSFGIGLYSIS